MTRVGDPERERAAAVLHRHYLRGRLSVEELADRTGMALQARSRSDLRAALADLPTVPELLVAGRTLVRGAVLVALVAAWLVFSLALLAVFGLVALFHGLSLEGSLAFPLMWLLGTWLLWRAARHAPPRRR